MVSAPASRLSGITAVARRGQAFCTDALFSISFASFLTFFAAEGGFGAV